MLKFLSRNIIQESSLHKYDQYLIDMRDVVKVYETDAGNFTALKNIKLAKLGPALGVHARPGILFVALQTKA